MSALGSQITSLTIVYSTLYSGADQRKHRSSASLAFVRGIHRWPVNSPHKGSLTRKMFPYDDVTMWLGVKSALGYQQLQCWLDDGHHVVWITGLILGLRPANKKRRYKVTSSLIGNAEQCHIQNIAHSWNWSNTPLRVNHRLSNVNAYIYIYICIIDLTVL